ncbi:M14 family metallopeptidase [Ottowia sp.]|uniref:M14 family metallopeptidase n=1 Tax=Ottowia sp. TaxID=1898956 RepID=UPI002CDECB01|nr:M14 family metallopeptidase [Ottowia sp.]HOB67253.1 M14 family metallopeptidase [Ottowia sp.]HPZ55756.1 M14 family metallopeptidase [Ottowia sp.]HQD46373.1 M14 family metallopeptidase [Ottowia sp.]
MLRWITRTVLALIALLMLAVGGALWRFANYAPADPVIEPDAAAQAYFIDDYAPARQAFLAKGQALAGRFERVEQFALPVASAQAQHLFVDGLYVPAQKSPKRLLVLSSAVHGVEGPAGSAVQRLFIDEFMTPEALQDTGVLLLHAVNPYGFAVRRRVTEQNIDLNRNASTTNALYLTDNAGYPLVDPLINPRDAVDTGAWANRLFLLRAVAQIAQHGMPPLRQAVLQGQYAYPKGIYYGGGALAPQLAALAPRLQALVNAYPLSMTIDLHTGYGARGKLHVFLNPPGDPRVRQGLEKVFDGPAIDWGTGKDFYTVTGDVTGWIGALRQHGLHLPAVFEYGTLDSQTTLGAIKSLHISVLENQGVQHGWASPADQARVAQDYREMFNPSSPAWRTKVIADSRAMLTQVMARLPSLQP